MALKNWFSLSALIAFLMIPAVAWGQFEDSQIHVPGPRFEHHQVEDPDSTRPLATPGVFNYDFQVFAPIEYSGGEELKPNTGFFFSVDRLYTSVSGGGDFGGKPTNYIWGNRYDFGFMNDSDDGWNFVYEQSEGSQNLNGTDPLATSPTQFSLRYGNLEINKVFRQELKHGGWVEPYIGLRYFNLSDRTTEDRFDLGVAMNRFNQLLTNNSVGFNVGGRIVKRSGRWRYSHDFSLSTTYNQQKLHAEDLTTVLGIIDTTVNTVSVSDQAFVPVVDYRFELAYNISRDFGFRAGAGVLYFWDGIARANTLTTQENPNSIFGFDPTLGGDPTITGGGIVDNRLITAGFSIGFEFKR